MNITKINDGFGEIDRLGKVEWNGKAWDSIDFVIPKTIYKSPIFVWDDFESEKLLSKDHYDVYEKIKRHQNLLPFKTMRLHINPNEEDKKGGTTAINCWLHHEKGIMRIRSQLMGLPNLPNAVYTTDVFPDMGGHNVGGYNVNVQSGGSFIMLNEINPILKEMFTKSANAIMTSVFWFIRESSMPSMFITKVSPNKKGKTTEWIESRSHYVLIDRKHPANNKHSKNGDKIEVSNNYSKRRAHTRRAHARVLRSSRFKNKQGQIIFVKSSWVGPNEWKQNASIYKLIKLAQY